MHPLRHLHQLARVHGSRAAIVATNDSITFAELPAAVIGLAHAVADGSAAGDRILVLLKNSLAYVLLQLGLDAIDRVRVPINWRATALELEQLIGSCRPAVLVYDDDTADSALAAIQRLAESHSPAPKLVNSSCIDWRLHRATSETLIAALCAEPPSHSALTSINYTSGTLGSPKGVMLTRGNWDAVHRNLLSVRDFRSSDRLGLVGPLSHAAGAYVLPALASGATLLLLAAPTPEVLHAAVFGAGMTILQCVPTMLTRVVNAKAFDREHGGGLRLIIYGGESMPANTLTECLATFGPILAQNYGLTEAMMTCATLQPHEHLDSSGNARHGVLGRPYPFVELALRRADGSEVEGDEIGEITIRSPHVMTGYWERPEDTARALRDGWLWSGDLARWEPDGFLQLTGRSKDLVISGGMNIYPREVESFLSSQPSVYEVAVFGAPDADWGERLVAAVVLDSADERARETLRSEMRKHLGIRCPKQWLWPSSLPRTGNGKIDVRALRNLVSAAA